LAKVSEMMAIRRLSITIMLKPAQTRKSPHTKNKDTLPNSSTLNSPRMSK